jgi:hypothetical protein
MIGFTRAGSQTEYSEIVVRLGIKTSREEIVHRATRERIGGINNPKSEFNSPLLRRNRAYTVRSTMLMKSNMYITESMNV